MCNSRQDTRVDHSQVLHYENGVSVVLLVLWGVVVRYLYAINLQVLIYYSKGVGLRTHLAGSRRMEGAASLGLDERLHLLVSLTVAPRELRPKGCDLTHEGLEGWRSPQDLQRILQT